MIKGIWNFLRNDDHPVAWIVNIILAFIFIKFILYPGLGLILGTQFPVVAVISESMEHDLTDHYTITIENNQYVKHQTDDLVMCGNIYDEDKFIFFDEYWKDCGDWYENRSITKADFESFRFKDGFNKGDVMVLSSKENIKVGDVIVFWSTQPDPIIHRVVEIKNGMYLTKGDHNSVEDGWTSEDRVLGKALLRVPYLGWVKILFVALTGVNL